MRGGTTDRVTAGLGMAEGTPLKDALASLKEKAAGKLTVAGWTGKVQAELYVSSTARDSDFIVRGSDVYPDGRSIFLTEGVIRDIMVFLQSHGVGTARDIAAHGLMHKSTVSRAVSTLEERGLLARLLAQHQLQIGLGLLELVQTEMRQSHQQQASHDRSLS